MRTYPPKPANLFLPEEILVELPEPVHGYWDGGPKSSFTFGLEVVDGGYERHWHLPYHFKVGSWGANFWFRMPPCRLPACAASRRLRGLLFPHEAKITIQRP